MPLIHWTPENAEAFLGAMKTVALAGSEEMGAIEREMLAATQRHVLHTHFDLDDIEALTPDALANSLPEPELRHQALEFLILLPYAPIEVDPAKVSTVDAFSTALGIATTTLEDLHRVRDRSLRRLQLDFGRRSLKEFVPGERYGAKLKTIVAAIRQALGQEAVAGRYHELEGLPAGSLGHTFFHFYRNREFPLPGEKGSLSELLVPHDMAHILAGCNTSMRGEIDVAGFEAGMSGREFGYELLLEVILDFHLGWAFTTAGIVEPSRGHLDPETLMSAYERGSGCKLNLMKNWDWWEVIEEPVRALRDRYGIRGAEDVVMPAPSES